MAACHIQWCVWHHPHCDTALINLSGVEQSRAGRVRAWTDTDDVAALTALLHIAYRPLLDEGMQYLAGTQDTATTLRRIGAGRQCWVIDEPLLIATATLTPPPLLHGCEFYERDDVASIGQVAVHPDWQGRGLGQALMEHAERAAAEMGALEVAIDTSEHAAHLIRWYESQGYRHVGYADWDVTNYRSVVLSKRVGKSIP